MTQGTAQDEEFMALALREAQDGYKEGGIPIGAILVSKDGKVLGRGHNMRIQKNSATLHAEISALESAGRLPATAYAGSTMVTFTHPKNENVFEIEDSS